MAALIRFLASVYHNMLKRPHFCEKDMGALIRFIPSGYPQSEKKLKSYYPYNEEYMHIGESFKGIIYTFCKNKSDKIIHCIPIHFSVFIIMYYCIRSTTVCKATFNNLSI